MEKFKSILFSLLFFCVVIAIAGKVAFEVTEFNNRSWFTKHYVPRNPNFTVPAPYEIIKVDGWYIIRRNTSLGYYYVNLNRYFFIENHVTTWATFEQAYRFKELDKAKGFLRGYVIYTPSHIKIN